MIVFVPGPVMIEGFGATMIVYGCCIIKNSSSGGLRSYHTLRYFPGVGSVFLKKDTSFAIFLDQLWYAGRHLLRGYSLQGFFYIAECREFAQLVNGGKDERKFLALETCQRLGGGDPDAFASLHVSISSPVVGKRSLKETVRD